MTYIIFYKLAAAFAFLFLKPLIGFTKNYATRMNVAIMINFGPFKSKGKRNAARKRSLEHGYKAVIYRNQTLLLIAPALYFMISGVALLFGLDLYYPKQLGAFVIFPVPLVIAYLSKHLIDFFVLFLSNATGSGINPEIWCDIKRHYRMRTRVTSSGGNNSKDRYDSYNSDDPFSSFYSPIDHYRRSDRGW